MGELQAVRRPWARGPSQALSAHLSTLDVNANNTHTSCGPAATRGVRSMNAIELPCPRNKRRDLRRVITQRHGNSSKTAGSSFA
nr:hypothetical protein [uncultured bacterium]